MKNSIESIALRFRHPGLAAMALMGSHARDEACEFSDVDVVGFLADEEDRRPAATHLVDGHFVNVSDVSPAGVETWFNDPRESTECIAGVRTARPLWDPDGHFRSIQERARSFVWDGRMQAKANEYSSSEMVGWIEEAMKGLEGLRTGDEGRMLNARHGLSWGLTNVMRVQRGILLASDNGSYAEVATALGNECEWVVVSRTAFGLDNSTLVEQVTAGLRLYALTYDLLVDVLKPDHERMIAAAVQVIRNPVIFS